MMASGRSPHDLEQIALDWNCLQFQERVTGFPSRQRDGNPMMLAKPKLERFQSGWKRSRTLIFRARFRLSYDRDPNSLANWEPGSASSHRALDRRLPRNRDRAQARHQFGHLRN